MNRRSFFKNTITTGVAAVCASTAIGVEIKQPLVLHGEKTSLGFLDTNMEPIKCHYRPMHPILGQDCLKCRGIPLPCKTVRDRVKFWFDKDYNELYEVIERGGNKLNVYNVEEPGDASTIKIKQKDVVWFRMPK